MHLVVANNTRKIINKDTHRNLMGTNIICLLPQFRKAAYRAFRSTHCDAATAPYRCQPLIDHNSQCNRPWQPGRLGEKLLQPDGRDFDRFPGLDPGENLVCLDHVVATRQSDITEPSAALLWISLIDTASSCRSSVVAIIQGPPAHAFPHRNAQR